MFGHQYSSNVRGFSFIETTVRPFIVPAAVIDPADVVGPVDVIVPVGAPKKKANAR